MDEYLHFSEFADEKDGYALEGAKRRLEEILNMEILITDYRLTPSKVNSGKCLTLQFKNNNDTFVIFTGSEVLAGQLERYADKLPFYATIIKRGRYFSLS